MVSAQPERSRDGRSEWPPIVAAMLKPCIAIVGIAFSITCLADEQTARKHSREEETAKISKHHLKRLEERLTTPLGVLRERCRFVSDVSTRPPSKKVALSFDDGPEPVHAEQILDVLKKHDVKAAFFLIGQKTSQHPELVAKIRAVGKHILGNHSWDHRNFHDISISEQADEVRKTDTLLGEAQTPRLFRYPYGNSTCETNALLHAEGYKIAGWHIDSCDWAFDRDGSVDLKEAISCGVLPQNRKDFVEHVVASVRSHDGGIVLLHEIHPNTLKKLDDIIAKLLGEGFVFVGLDDPDFDPSLR